MISGVLFDKDDTLIDLASFWREPVQRTVSYMLQCCDREWDTELMQKMIYAAGFEHDILRPTSPVVAGTNWDLIDACIAEMPAKGIPVWEGLREQGVLYLENACIRYGRVVGKADFQTILPLLKSYGLRLGVATSDHYDSTIHCLQALGIQQYFDMVLTADHVKLPKPEPEMAQTFCRRFEIPPERVAMVGDSGNDMLFAKNSGLIGIYFQHPPMTAVPENAQYVLSDLNQLPTLIEQLLYK